MSRTSMYILLQTQQAVTIISNWFQEKVELLALENRPVITRSADMMSKVLCLLLLIGLDGMCYGDDCLSQLPPMAREAISGLEGWHLVKLTDLPPDDQKLWQTSHSERCPGVAAGNFTGGGQLSYAIAVIRNQPSGQILEQLIALVPHGNLFKRTVVVQPMSVVSPVVVWKVKPGKYKGVDQDKPIQISHDSFVYEKMEAYATQYYYDKGSLRSIVTAD